MKHAELYKLKPEIMRLKVEGYTAGEVAAKLGVTKSTVYRVSNDVKNGIERRMPKELQSKEASPVELPKPIEIRQSVKPPVQPKPPKPVKVVKPKPKPVRIEDMPLPRNFEYATFARKMMRLNQVDQIVSLGYTRTEAEAWLDEHGVFSSIELPPKKIAISNLY